MGRPGRLDRLTDASATSGKGPGAVGKAMMPPSRSGLGESGDGALGWAKARRFGEGPRVRLVDSRDSKRRASQVPQRSAPGRDAREPHEYAPVGQHDRPATVNPPGRRCSGRAFARLSGRRLVGGESRSAAGRAPRARGSRRTWRTSPPLGDAELEARMETAARTGGRRAPARRPSG